MLFKNGVKFTQNILYGTFVTQYKTKESFFRTSCAIPVERAKMKEGETKGFMFLKGMTLYHIRKNLYIKEVEEKNPKKI